MKKLIVLPIFLFIALGGFCQLNASFEKDTLNYERDELVGQIIKITVKISGSNSYSGSVNVINFAIDPSPATTMDLSDFNFTQQSIPVAQGTSQIFCAISISNGQNPVDNVLYISVQMSYSNPTVHTKNIVLKIVNKKKKADDITTDEAKKGKVKDNANLLKTEIVQYSDVTGIKNDLPNGLLQYQGILKIPINHHKYLAGNDWSFQGFRSIIVDLTINRIDKSKEEIDYNYTAFLYQNNVAKKTSNPWLATTDIWRYSNFQAGIRIVPLAIDKGNFRIQFQGGFRLLKNRPFSEDTVRSGVDSGKVKSDFRSVYSSIKYVELYIKSIALDSKLDISLNTGFMWLTLMDSYYKQIEIHQQDPFQRTIALSTVEGYKKNSPMWFTSFRLGYLIGEEKIVSTFFRLNYMLQKGTYLSPLSNIIDGRPVFFEEKRFYNNFFQVHLGTTIELGKLFGNKEKKDAAKSTKKDDGPVSNSNSL